jgi:putative hemolysin
MSITKVVVSAVALLFLSGFFLAATAQTTIQADQEKYCTFTGGELESRVPVYGTNGPGSSWLRLSGSEEFCQYTSTHNGSRIHISLKTLFSPKPTLAALAYYAQVPWNGQGGGNPASYYCTQLGGSDLFGGATAAGGGWVKFNTTDVVLEACIFPDNSTIDSWGLLYHANNIIRGRDLSTVLKYSNPYAVKKPSTP